MTTDPARTAASVTPYPDGPLVVRGDFVLCDLDGTPIGPPGRTVALCRCGRSGRRPFCDGSHRTAPRRRAGTAHDEPPPDSPPESPDSPAACCNSA